MKVLLINKYFYIKGGTETYYFGIKNMLEENGHKVICFSMQDDKNYKSEYERYFVNNIDYSNTSIIGKIKDAIKLINSKEAYNNLCNLIESTKPDIAHVNLIYHQLTPAIFHALKKYNIPIVFTSHDYKMICPNYKLYNKDKICKKCYGGKYYNCVINKCHKHSFSYSLILMIEAYYHRIQRSYELSNKVICPSCFIKEQIALAGMCKGKLVYIPNFIDSEFYNVKKDEIRLKKENVVLYYGRLSKEKGIETLIEAKRNLDDNIKVKIIGIGPQEEYLKNKIKSKKIKNIEFLGFKRGKELIEEIRRSKCTIIPSVWDEVFGLTIVESFSLGIPVVGSAVGGITENIKDGITGYLFSPSNTKELAIKINKIINMDDIDYFQMVKSCYEEKELYSPNAYYLKLIELYKDTIKQYSIGES